MENGHEGDGYLVIAWIVGGITALLIWVYSFFAWGLLFGLMVGWIPALIGGAIAGILWPLVLLVIGGLIFLITKQR